MTASSQKPCPICKLDSKDVNVTDYGERLTLNCERCGRFTITATAAAIAAQKDLTSELTAWIRQRSEKSENVPEINSRSLEEIVRSLPKYRFEEKQALLRRKKAELE